MKVAIYCRVSTDKQTTENQRPALEAYANGRRWDIVEVYQENESAYHSGRQIELQRLKDDCRNGTRPDVVLVWDLSRLSRQGIAHVFGLFQYFKALNVKIISLKEPWLESEGMFADIVLAVFASMAKYESEIKSERVKAGQARARSQGTHLGRPAGKKDSVKRRRSGYLLRYADRRISGSGK